jgi:hypothetical protein
VAKHLTGRPISENPCFSIGSQAISWAVKLAWELGVFTPSQAPGGTQSQHYVTCSVSCVNTASAAISASWCGEPRWWLAACRFQRSVFSGLFPEKLSPIQLHHNRGCDPGETEAALLADFWHLLEKRNFDSKAISSVGAPAQPGSDLGGPEGFQID